MLNTIWVDADACPVAIKEILFRAAERTGTQTTLVANQMVRVPPSKFISFLVINKEMMRGSGNLFSFYFLARRVFEQQQ